MATIKFDHVYITYPGNEDPTVIDFDLKINDGEFIVIVGPSGCGKTTTLRALAGLEPVSAGRIFIGDKDVTNLAPKDRDIAMVFQNYALYPHMTVAANIGFALKIAGVKKDKIEKKVAETAELLGLTQYLKRKPKALSGGQRQRVAMGRAIVRQPNVFLMDEPLSNLDTKLRVSTRTQIAALQDKLGVTTVYVTHDQTEAMTMGDRIIVMKDGVIQQVGSPTEQYQKPNNLFVAGFIGSPAMNIGKFRIQSGKAIVTKENSLSIPLDVLDKLKANKEDSVVIGIRPENLELSEKKEDSIPIDIDVVENMGSDLYGYGKIHGLDSVAQMKTAQAGDDKDGDIQNQEIIIRTPGFIPMKEKETVYGWPSSTHYFSALTGERLGEMNR